MEIKDQVLEAMRKAGRPLSSSEVVKTTGLPKAEVDKAFAALKKDQAIVSPVRCKWEPVI